MAIAELNDATPPVAAAAGLEWKIDGAFLFEAIICDLHSCAMQVAMLAIMLSAWGRPECAAALRSGRHLLHDDSMIMELALQYGEDIGLPAAAVKRIASLYRGVGAAKQTLSPLLQASSRSPSQSDSLLNDRQVWRRLAASASEALAAVDSLTRSRLSAVYGEDATTLRKFLKEAADGDIRRVDAAGTIQAPLLRQKRNNPRVAVRWPCKIVLPGGSHSARIADVSRDGLGIECSSALADQQAVRVALEDGRQLEATVVRRQGNHFGLSLRTRLSSKDPLFNPRRRD